MLTTSNNYALSDFVTIRSFIYGSVGLLHSPHYHAYGSCTGDGMPWHYGIMPGSVFDVGLQAFRLDQHPILRPVHLQHLPQQAQYMVSKRTLDLLVDLGLYLGDVWIPWPHDSL